MLYCPDYVVNAGGLINVSREVLRLRDPGWVARHLDQAALRFEDLLEQAHRQGKPPQHVAEAMVTQILRAARATGPAEVAGPVGQSG